MSGSIIPISDEQAKLGQEILKTLRGLGSFIEKALGSTPEDYRLFRRRSATSSPRREFGEVA